MNRGADLRIALAVLGVVACGGAERQSGVAGSPDSASGVWAVETVATIRAGEDAPFMRVTSLAADAGGNVYVLDHGARNIRVFDSAGRPVRTIGREGRGPAEFVRPWSLAWTGDTLVVFDPGTGRLELVDRDGGHVASWPGSRKSGPGVRLWQAGASRIFMDGYRPSGDGKMQALFVSAGPGGAKDTLVIPERSAADMNAAVTCHLGNGTITWFDVPFAWRRVDAVSTDGLLVQAGTGRYAFTWADGAGQVRRTIEFEADPLPIPDPVWDSVQTEFQRWRDKLQGAACQPADLPRPSGREVFRSIEFDDRGRLWVEAATGPGYRFDVWDPASGSRLGSVPASVRDPEVPFLVRGDRIYTVNDETGEQVVEVRRFAAP